MAKPFGFLAGAFAQQEEVVAGAEARVFQEQVGALALASRQTFLHIPDLADRQGETLGNGDPLALFADQFVGGFLHRWDGRHAFLLQLRDARRQGRPEQCGEEEGRGYRLALANARIGIGQGLADQLAGVVGVGLQCLGAGREQRREQFVLDQQLESALGPAGEEQLEHLVEQARRRDFPQQRGQPANRRGAVLFDLEVELGGETYRPQHPHRVFQITLLRIADQADQAIADVVNAIGVVQQPLAGDVEVQGIDGEVAALGVVFQAAIDVVAQDAAAFVAGRAAIAIVLAFRMMGAEGGDLDDLAAEVHVYQFEAAADDPRVAEFGADLLRRGAGGDIEVLGSDAEHLVAYAAPDHVGLVAGPLEDLDDLDGVPAELVPAQGMLVVTDDFRGCTDGARTAQGGTNGLDQLFQHGCVIGSTMWVIARLRCSNRTDVG